MKRIAIVKIRENSSGEVRESEYDYNENEDHDSRFYLWEEGNWACDCNRSIIFHRSSSGLEDIECGNELYSIQITDRETKEILYDEFAD